VAGVSLPPLRNRREDIPYLTAAFMRDISARMRKPITGLTLGAERLLLAARWDGNVRELRNTIERMCLLSEGSIVSERDLRNAFGSLRAQAAAPVAADAAAHDGQAALVELERDRIVDVLRQVRGNRMAAAKLLGISRRALYRRLERYNI